MRRLTAGALAACLALPVLGAGAVPAVAQPTTEPAESAGPEVPEPVPGEQACTISDPRLAELSGLVAVESGYLVVNDGTQFADREGVFFLDQQCQVTDHVGYPSPPLDPEDLALDRESNTLWVADVGDNFETTGQNPRSTVALWRIELDGDRVAVIYRFTYPDGEAYDAETLLLDGDGTPIIVTKSIGGAGVFTPAAELRPSNGPDDALPLERRGELTVPDTGTAHPLGPVAREVITGGDNSPGGAAVVLRTYTDAFEYDVSGGDVVAAITGGEPRITPLPDEPLGEAISYSPDGERFLTVSEVPAEATDFSPVVLSYTPTAPPPEPAGQATEPAAQGGGGGGGLFDDLQDIINLIAAVGVVGLLLVAAGVFGIVRARRRGAGAGTGADPGGGGGGGAGGGAVAAAPVTGRVRAVGEPGGSEPGQPPHPAMGAAGVYTSGTARQPGTEYGSGTEYRATGYGGGEYGGTDYGAAGYGGGTEYRGTEYGGGREYGGAEYGGGREYGAAEYGPGGYGGDDPAGYRQYDRHGPYAGYGPAGPGAEYGYPGGTYGTAQPEQPYDPNWANGHHEGGTYRSGGGHHAGGAGYSASPDYYPDDPDYPYVFRRGDWPSR